MIQKFRTSRLGFTLIELAIVLAVAGVLFAGIWRLLSGGNQQLRDQSVAGSQVQLINAVKGFLASSQGQTKYLANIGANKNLVLQLPSSPPDGGQNLACIASLALFPNQTDLCNFLPVGFSSTTTNGYGQNYLVQVLKDNTTNAPPTPPNTYSFMIMTTLGDVIPDTSGGRISAVIGGDGGFIYGSDVCNAAFNKWACGSYGAWSVNVITGYGFVAATVASGHIASRTYVSAEQESGLPWLARNYIAADVGYNTMNTDLFMAQNHNGFPNVMSNLYMAPSGTTTGGGMIALQGGAITLGSVLKVNTPPAANTFYLGDYKNGLLPGTASITGNEGSTINLLSTLARPYTSGNGYSPFIQLTTGCTVDTSTGALLTYNKFCVPGLGVAGDIVSSGEVNAYTLYAVGFLYQTSDIRLKKDIRPLHDSLDNLMKIKPVSFTMKETGAKNIGVIAQDVEKVYPQLVTPGDGMKAVAYTGLIGPLIGAVQELKQQNDELRRLIADQTVREERLEQQLHALNPSK